MSQSEKYKDIDFDLIIASPLMRTMQTANIMNKFHNRKIIKDERIIEFDQGILTGRKVSSFNEEEQEARRLRLKSYGIETFNEIYGRCKNFVDYLKTIKGINNLLIVTHGGIAHSVYSILNGLNEQDIIANMRNGEFKNAEIKKFVI